MMRSLKEMESLTGHLLVPTNLDGAYSFKPAAHDFTLSKAHAHELRAHGFPRRPAARDHPRLHSAWSSAFAEPWSPKLQIIPQLEVIGVSKRHPRKRVFDPTTQIHNSWSGVVCRDPFPDVNRDLSVVGQWTVPTVTPPANHRQTGPIVGITEFGWDSSSWIGIDGFSIDSSDVLQAGVQHYVLQSGGSVYLPWFEWYVPQDLPGDPDYIFQTRITNFEVKPGDQVSCNISYVGHQYGTVSFSNSTSGGSFSMALAPPFNASFNARSIEWIFEAPSGGWPDGAIVPDFTAVVFFNAFGCGGAVGDLVDPQSGTQLILQEGSAIDPFVQTSVRTELYSVTISQQPL